MEVLALIIRHLLAAAIGLSAATTFAQPAVSQDNSATNPGSGLNRLKRLKPKSDVKPVVPAVPKSADGVALITTRNLGVTSAMDLTGAFVCFEYNTPAERKWTDFFQRNKIVIEPYVVETREEVLSAYDAVKCDVLAIAHVDATTAISNLTTPANHIIMDEIIN